MKREYGRNRYSDIEDKQRQEEYQKHYCEATKLALKKKIICFFYIK